MTTTSSKLSSWYPLALFAFAIVSFAAFSSVYARTMTASASVVGTYNAVGKNAGGGEYHGTVTIAKKGEAYELKWQIGQEQYSGIGFVDNNVLSSNWVITANGTTTTGVVAYKMENGKPTKGKWTAFPGNGKILTEDLTPKR